MQVQKSFEAAALIKFLMFVAQRNHSFIGPDLTAIFRFCRSHPITIALLIGFGQAFKKSGSLGILSQQQL
jgi:hypothetical protein